MRPDCSLRIIHINDVYILDNFPSLATLIKEKSVGPDCTIAVLAGDFVAPSLLSALDMGFGMVETMLQAGIRYVCFGNHENSIPLNALFKRIEEFQSGGGIWLNTNMPDFPVALPKYTILEVKGQTKTRKIGLLGLLCNYPGIYVKGAFGGAVPSMESVNDAAVRYRSKLYDEQAVDLVVPMTHQSIADDDRILAEMTLEDRKTPLFPVILGGHDHGEFLEQAASGSWIVKAGSDAHKTSIVDITWDDETTSLPQVTIELVETKKWPEDPEVKATAERHQAVLNALDSAVIYRHPKQAPLLSSKQMRLGQTTMSTLLCTAVRESLSYNTPDHPVDCTLLQSRMIRGDRDYPNGLFTLAALHLELPVSRDVVVVPMPGRVIAAALKDSRADEGEVNRSRYLHTCDNLVVAPHGEKVLSIKGQPLSPDKVYTVAIQIDLLTGLDNIDDIIDYAKNELPGGPPPSDAGRPIMPVILDYFMRQLWQRLPAFDTIDINGDGSLSHEEVKEAYTQVFGWDADGDGIITEDEKRAVELLVQALIKVLDMDDNGEIDRQEYEHFVVTQAPAVSPANLPNKS